jgi:hypothetical protein
MKYTKYQISAVFATIFAMLAILYEEALVQCDIMLTKVKMSGYSWGIPEPDYKVQLFLRPSMEGVGRYLPRWVRW